MVILIAVYIELGDIYLGTSPILHEGYKKAGKRVCGWGVA